MNSRLIHLYLLVSLSLSNLSVLLGQLCPEELPDAAYTFTNGLVDDSGNNRLASTMGNATVESYLSLPNDANSALLLPAEVLDGAEDFTIAFSVRFTTLHTEPTENGFDPINVIVNGFATNNAFTIGYRKRENSIHFSFAGSGYEISLEDELQEDNWYCWGITRSGNLLNVYLDGDRVGADIVVSNAPVEILPSGLVIGQDQDCLTGCYEQNQSMAGDLDDLLIYRQAKAAAFFTSNCQIIERHVSICEGQNFASYSTAGRYWLQEINCAQPELLDLEVRPNAASVQYIYSCDGSGFETYTESGIYLDTLAAKNGCDSIVRTELAINDFYIPNAFSPNYDGINDRFRLYSRAEPPLVVDFSIYDRWGGLLYHESNFMANELEKWWNGDSDGKQLPPGSYLYRIELECYEERVSFTGTVQLVR